MYIGYDKFVHPATKAKLYAGKISINRVPRHTRRRQKRAWDAETYAKKVWTRYERIFHGKNCKED